MDLRTFLIIVGIQTVLSGLVALIAFYKLKQRTRIAKLIGLLFAISMVCNLSALLLRKYFPSLINISGSIYDLSFIVILTIIFNEALSHKYAKVFNAITIVFTLCAIMNLLFWQKAEIASFNKLAISFIIILYTVVYFYRLMKDLPTFHLTRLPMFWFSSAFLIYGAGALFLFAFLDYLVNVLNNNLLTYWTFHNGLSIFQQLLIIVGLMYERSTILQPSVLQKSKN
jgi:hypothetical protein